MRPCGRSHSSTDILSSIPAHVCCHYHHPPLSHAPFLLLVPYSAVQGLGGLVIQKFGPVCDWVIDYSPSPGIWIVTKDAWCVEGKIN